MIESLARSLEKKVCSSECFCLTGTSGTDDGYFVAGEIGGDDLLCDGVEEFSDRGSTVFLNDPFRSWIIGGGSKVCGRWHSGGMVGGQNAKERQVGMIDGSECGEVGC